MSLSKGPTGLKNPTQGLEISFLKKKYKWEGQFWWPRNMKEKNIYIYIY